MKNTRLKNNNTLLLIIDVQEKLYKSMFNRENLKDNIVKLVKSFDVLKTPIVFFEQNPKGLGPTIPEIKESAGEFILFEKMSFGIGSNKGFYDFIEDKGIKNIVICGIETHVCVFQSARDLIEKGYNLHIVTDAVTSRKESDNITGIKRIEYEGGVVSSSEIIIFDLLHRCDKEEFKPILNLVK